MTILSLREVDRTNWRATLDLSVRPEQQRFIADHTPIASIALAKAFIRPGDKLWIPYAVYAAEAMIGFIELACNPDSHDDYWVYHFFIDQAQQGKGYAVPAMQTFVTTVKERFPVCEQIHLTVHPENIVAQHVYSNIGFRPNGEILYGEPVYTLVLPE